MRCRRVSTDLLIEAVIRNDAEAVSEILNHGINPNHSLDSAQLTPLHHAAQANSLEVVPLLVEAGARLGSKTKPDGYTAIEVAFLHGNYKLAQTLMAYLNQTDRMEH